MLRYPADYLKLWIQMLPEQNGTICTILFQHETCTVMGPGMLKPTVPIMAVLVCSDPHWYMLMVAY